MAEILICEIKIDQSLKDQAELSQSYQQSIDLK